MQKAVEFRQIRGPSEKPAVAAPIRGSQGKVLIVVCAHNEVQFIPALLEKLGPIEVLVVDDGSTDGTAAAAHSGGAYVLRHAQRLGKSASLAHAIEYALENDYRIIVEIGADAIPESGSISVMLRLLESDKIGGVSVMQTPIGPSNPAYHIDELMWATLGEGKKLQMARYGNSHLGGVMYAFKPNCVDSVNGSVNDDEQLGASINVKGFKTVFVEGSSAYFDASTSLGHILERRKRMYFGHMMFRKSTAPSMDTAVAAGAFLTALFNKPSRLVWAIPTLVMELIARLLAWRDLRRPGSKESYTRWVTTYAKNHLAHLRNG